MNGTRENLILDLERQGARLLFLVRMVTLAVVAVFFVATAARTVDLAWVLIVLAGFALTGLLHHLLARRTGRHRLLGLLFATLDIMLLTLVLASPNPLSGERLPPAVSVDENQFMYLLLFITFTGLSLTPWLSAWVGVVTALCWGAALMWALAQPQTLSILNTPNPDGLPVDERLRIVSDPNYLDLTNQAANMLIGLIIAGTLTAVVWRAQRLMQKYAVAERSRGNLARHFSPNMVDVLAKADEPFGPVRRQEAGVLFVDIRGFTSFAEASRPEEVLALLREFHRRMERIIFEAGGTVDNYIGDCVMATFGVPQAQGRDAARALEAALAMVADLAAWNRERATRGEPPVDARIGLHYGTVVTGAVGSERNLAFAVIGDTCNVASRLQTLCRDLKAAVCASGEFVEAARRQGADAALRDLVDRGERKLRGRTGAMRIWVLPLPRGTTL
jgi:adenylate cyclase